MKMKNEMKNETTTKVRKPRAAKEYMLYAEGHGFIYVDENGMPGFEGTNLLVIESKPKALYAKEFFTNQLKMAESISIFVKVA